MLMGNCVTDIYPLNGCLFLFSNRPLNVVGFSKIIIFAKNLNRAMIIPSGSSPEDIKIRKQIISDFYAQWNAEHPDKKVWNKSLHAFIHVKFHSINETRGHASGTYESTEAVLHLTDILQNARISRQKPKKKEDKNQKIYSKMVIMRYGKIKLTVGYQKAKNEYVQYCITVPGARKQKK